MWITGEGPYCDGSLSILSHEIRIVVKSVEETAARLLSILSHEISDADLAFFDPSSPFYGDLSAGVKFFVVLFILRLGL